MTAPVAKVHVAATIVRARMMRRWSWTRVASFGFTVPAVFFLATMMGLFLWQSLPVWRHAGWDYIIGEQWHYRQREFGALAMIYGTFIVSVAALLLAGPIGIGAALFTAEILPPGWRLTVKGAIELLAGVPSVVYGLLGILFLREWIYHALQPFEPLSGDTLLTAGVLLAVMILPTVTTLSDDALRGVPIGQRLAARALGLTRAEAVFAIALPQARRGVFAALLLGIGRALGETIAVFLVVGRRDNVLPETPWSLRPLIEAGQTLTSKLGGSETNIAYGDPLHWAAMAGLGLILLAIAGAVTCLAARLMRGKEAHAPLG
ncbi:MAG: phosphate ABC transporter permease subunit PstC [Opitutaceae bacterium]